MVFKFFGHLFREADERLNFRYFAWRTMHERKHIRRLISQTEQLGKNSSAEPKVSVVMPFYQIPMQDFNECLASLEKQTYKAWELCLCVDGSEDQALAKCLEKFESKNPGRLKIHRHSSNQGILEATRSAMKLVSGDYVAFVDADDLLPRRAFELSKAFANAHPTAEMFYSDHDYLSNFGWRWRACAKPEWSPETLINVNYVNHLTIAKTEFAREVLGEIPAECNGAQDWCFAFAAVKKESEVIHIPAVLYHWRMRPGSMALDGQAKPWALKAQTAARKHFIQNTIGAAVDLGSIGQFKTQIPAYIQWIEADENTTFENLRQEISGLESRLIGLKIKNRYLTVNDLERSAFYLSLPKIKAVWPFLTSGAHALTKGRRTSFTMFDGNIETGSTHGMMIYKDFFLNWLSHQSNLEFSIAEIGPRLSEDLKREGFRNVASAGILAGS